MYKQLIISTSWYTLKSAVHFSMSLAIAIYIGQDAIFAIFKFANYARHALKQNKHPFTSRMIDQNEIYLLVIRSVRIIYILIIIGIEMNTIVTYLLI